MSFKSLVKELWGIGKSGYRCKVCQISCHKDCKNHVVMECRPNRTLSLREKPNKSQRKRLKYVDLEFHGSTDSQLSASDTDTAASPSISRNSLLMTDVFSHSFDVNDSAQSYVGRLKEKIAKLEMEKDTLKKENGALRNKLTSTESHVTVLQSQLGLVRQQSVRFMLEQMERLNTCKETDV